MKMIFVILLLDEQVPGGGRRIFSKQLHPTPATRMPWANSLCLADFAFNEANRLGT
jgi:hypothetical protein